ncbi:MAG: hypothetical protein VKK04_19425 [Synechococcales bacterium]|nr:hypothetical protein [Synechococcales bacterium]
MAEFVAHSEFAEAVAQLLSRYGFDLEGRSPQFTIARWRQHYPESWLRLAVLEALYQGRYKVVSVEQILRLWQRRGHPVCHFNGEFARIICDDFPHPAGEAEAERGALDVSPCPAPSASDSWTEGGDRLRFPRASPALPPKGAVPPPPESDEVKFSTWVQASGGPHPIHRFVPVAEPSSFYARLREIANHGEEPSLPQPSASSCAPPKSSQNVKEPQLENVSGLDPEHLG